MSDWKETGKAKETKREDMDMETIRSSMQGPSNEPVEHYLDQSNPAESEPIILPDPPAEGEPEPAGYYPGRAMHPPEHKPQGAVGDVGDAERAESGAEKMEKRRFSGYGRGPETHEGKKSEPPEGWRPGGAEGKG
jgi:hypothetical protein